MFSKSWNSRSSSALFCAKVPAATYAVPGAMMVFGLLEMGRRRLARATADRRSAVRHFGM